MREIPNFSEVKENQGGEFERLPAGGYICKITSVTDKPEKEYLEIEYDIAEGKYIGTFAETYQRAGFWVGRLIRSYKESAAGFFKGFVTAVEQSNAGYKWAWQEKTLVGKLIGLVLGYEEYVNQMGEVKERMTAVQNRSVESIKKGDFKIPDVKRLKTSAAAPNNVPQGFTEMPAEQLPF